MATDEMEQLLRRISDSMKLGVVGVDDLENMQKGL